MPHQHHRARVQNLWLLKEILDPDGLDAELLDTPVSVHYEGITFSNASFSYENKLSEVVWEPVYDI